MVGGQEREIGARPIVVQLSAMAAHAQSRQCFLMTAENSEVQCIFFKKETDILKNVFLKKSEKCSSNKNTLKKLETPENEVEFGEMCTFQIGN